MAVALLCLPRCLPVRPTPTSARLFLLGGITQEEAAYLEAACKYVRPLPTKFVARAWKFVCE